MKSVKIYNPTKYQEDFIGTKFSEKGKGVLTVTGVYKKGNNTLFSVSCSICSEDKELFPEEEMLISKNNLKSGKYPCECSAGWKPSIYQYRVLIERFKVTSNDTSVNLLDGLTVKVETPDYGEWYCHVAQYLRGKRSYKESLDIRNKNLRVTDEEYTRRFMSTGKFLEGTKFWRSNRKDSRGYSVYYNYTCPVCSKDEYVENGLCSGIFEACSSTLKVGSRSCRCVRTFRWTKEQREYQLQKVLMSEGLEFSGWAEDYKGAFTKFNWTCNKGHHNTTELSNFLHLNHRCSTCAEGLWGFYKNRLSDTDTLYLLAFNKESERFLKVGRTFKLAERLKYFKNFYEVDVIATIKDTHEVVHSLESFFKKLLTREDYLYTPLTPFDGSISECFTSEILSHPEIISTFSLQPSDTHLSHQDEGESLSF